MVATRSRSRVSHDAENTSPSSSQEQEEQQPASSSDKHQPTTKKVETVSKAKFAGIRGVPKSGRPWKTVQSRRASSSIVKSKANLLTWAEKKAKREEVERAKALDKELRERREQVAQEKLDKMMAKRKRKEENEKKTQIIQKITNKAKLKRMSKKQFKQLKRV